MVEKRKERRSFLKKLDWEESILKKFNLSIKDDRIKELIVLSKKIFNIGIIDTISFSKVIKAVSIISAIDTPDIVNVVDIINIIDILRKFEKVIMPLLERFVIFTLRLLRKYWNKKSRKSIITIQLSTFY